MVNCEDVDLDTPNPEHHVKGEWSFICMSVCFITMWLKAFMSQQPKIRETTMQQSHRIHRKMKPLQDYKHIGKEIPFKLSFFPQDRGLQISVPGSARGCGFQMKAESMSAGRACFYSVGFVS